jgi:S1-C subfamily serine protease
MRLVASAAAATTALALAATASGLDPQSFAEVASGVVLVRATGCPGGRTQTGSGFLVGTSVVMTAHHVVKGCRSARVLVQEKTWVDVAHSTYWRDRGADVDVSTLKLARQFDGVWIFRLRPAQIPVGGKVAALGHPLGAAVSYVNGRVVGRLAGQHLLLRMLGAQGMSGGPIVDVQRQVVGLVNAGIGKPGFLTGAVTGDNVIAYDISSRWGSWRRTLCHAYPLGGIPGCG